MPPSAHPSTLLAPFQSLFSAPTWRKVQRLIVGTLLAHGRRTVTAAPTTHGTRRHGVVQSLPSGVQPGSMVRSPRAAAVFCPCWCRPSTPPGGSLTFVIDETLERRWGRRISKRGHHRDPLASSRKRSVSTSGLRWIVLTLVVTPPWTTRCWALPILSVPAPTPKVSERLGLRHKTIAQWARQMYPGGASLAAASRHHRAWRSILQCRGTRACLPALRGGA